jgi:hypothetical protein
MLNFAQLGEKLPVESVRWAGFGSPLTLNANSITEDSVTPETGVLETLAKLLEAAYQAQEAMNMQRELAGQERLTIVRRTVITDNDTPIFNYTLEVEIDIQAALNNLVDPSAEAS